MSGLSAVVGARGGTLQSDCAVRVHSCRAGEHPTSGRRVVFREQTRRDGGRYKRGLTDRQNRCIASLISLSAVTCLRPLRLASRRRGPRHSKRERGQYSSIYNKARGAEDGTPTLVPFPSTRDKPTRAHTCHIPRRPHLVLDIGVKGHRPKRSETPKRRKPAHSAHHSPAPTRAHTLAAAPRGTPSAPSNWFMLVRGGRSTGAHLHAI